MKTTRTPYGCWRHQNTCKPRYGRVFKEDKITHFEMKSDSWKCKRYREDLWTLWQLKIDVNWPTDRLYIYFVEGDRVAVRKLRKKLNIKEAFIVAAGKDRFLMVSNNPFKNGERTTATKVFKIMRHYLFSFHFYHSENQQISTTQAFGASLKSKVIHYTSKEYSYVDNFDPEMQSKALLVARILKMGVVENRKPALAHSFPNEKNDQELEQLDSKWWHLSNMEKAMSLKSQATKGSIKLQPEGRRFIEEHGKGEAVFSGEAHVIFDFEKEPR